MEEEEEQEDGRRRKWEDLPLDCLVEVFSKLNMEDRILRLAFVCRSWNEASRDPQCWRVLDLGENHIDLAPWGAVAARFCCEFQIPKFNFSGFMKLAVRRSRRSATELSFPFLFGPSVQDLAYASNECPRVKRVILPNILRQDEDQIRRIIGKWKDLEYLELGLKPTCLEQMLKEISRNCKNFVGLKMYGWFNSCSARAIAQTLPDLKFLTLRGSFLCNEQIVIILEGCRGLETFDISRCRGFAVDDEIIKKASGIREFDYKGSKLEEDYWDLCLEYSDVCWAMICGDC